MRYALLDVLACPDDRRWPLEISAVGRHAAVPAPERVQPCAGYCARRDSHEPPVDTATCVTCGETDLLEATIHCPDCGAEFAVEQGVARMLPRELRAHAGAAEDEPEPSPAEAEVADKVSELRARDREVEEYDRMTGLALLTRLEWPRVREALRPSVADRVLEVGCGTGRMTQRLCQESASLVAVDFSFNSLVRCRGKLSSGSAVHLVQADATRLPLRDAVADKVLTCQVVEHLPSEEARRAMMGEIRRTTSAGAMVVGTAYRYSWLTRLAGGKEGYHKGGIYFFRFRRNELADLWSVAVESADVAKLTPYLFLARGRTSSGDAGRRQVHAGDGGTRA